METIADLYEFMGSLEPQTNSFKIHLHHIIGISNLFEFNLIKTDWFLLNINSTIIVAPG